MITKNIIYPLIKLFAIAVNKQENSNEALIVDKFNEYLFENIEEKYKNTLNELFTNALDEYSSFKSLKKTSLNSVRLLRICDDISNELSEQERIRILLSLIILINKTEDIEKSVAYLQLVADSFLIDKNLFSAILLFVNNQESDNISVLQIGEVNVAEYIICSSDLVLFKPLEDKLLQINNIQGFIEKLYLLDENAVVLYDDNSKFFLNDLMSVKKSQLRKQFQVHVNEIEVVKKNKILLNKTSLTLNSGELIGVIGKSGVGKTTLLKAIANKSELKDVVSVSFLEQEEDFIPLFSIKEHIEQRLAFLQITKNN